MKSGANPPALGRPREVRADHAIFAGALELIAERELRELRRDDVADRAGVAKATIYRRYRSKEELVTAAVTALVSRSPSWTPARPARICWC